MISDFMLTDARGVLIGARPLTSELRTEQVNQRRAGAPVRSVRLKKCVPVGRAHSWKGDDRAIMIEGVLRVESSRRGAFQMGEAHPT